MILVLIWVFSIFIISYLGFTALISSPQYITKDIANYFLSFSNWDGKHFINIAQSGYEAQFQYAFFPLYPLLIRILSFLTNNYTASALIISSAAFILGINIFYKLVKLEFNKDKAYKSVTFLLMFPASFYFLTAYSESLFFLLAVLTFYFLKKKNLYLACFFVSLASATRISGVALLFGLFAWVIIEKKIKNRWIVLLAPTGLFFYIFYQFLETGNPLNFLVSETYWQRYITFPGLGFWDGIRNILLPGFLSRYFMSIIDLIFAVFGLGMVLRAFRFLPLHYSIYGLVSVIIPLLTPSLSSMPRFLLPIFPIFILMAFIKTKYMIFLYQFIATALLATFVLLFINGFWVS